MRNLCLFVLLIFALSFSIPSPVLAQDSRPVIAVLDKNGDETGHTIDGNAIQLKITLPAKATAEVHVSFLLDELETPIGACTVTIDSDTCTTEKIDALGWYWNPEGVKVPSRTIRASLEGVVQPGGKQVDVLPRPVVLVHGFNSNWQAWTHYLGAEGYLAALGLQGFAVGDGQVPGTLNTGDFTNPAKRTNTIAQNAAIVGEYISGVQRKTGAEKVDLLVHSMGGMISRYYLDKVMTDRNVAELIILGTPNAGSNCAILPASLGFYLPASLEILPSYMTSVFNQQVTNRRGVPFHAVAGTLILDPVGSPCTGVPSDTVVSIESLSAIPVDYQKIALFHGDLTTDSNVFESFVRPLLQTPPGEFWTSPPPDAVSFASTPLQFSRVYTGHVNPGQSQQVTINIDPNVTVANFALYDSSRSLDIVVNGANGNVLALDPVKNGMVKVDDPATMIYLGYGFQQPKPGKWIVTLTATNTTPAQGADFALTAKFEGGAVLQTSADIILPALNQPVTIRASLAEGNTPLPMTAAQALFRKPDGSTETLALQQSGGLFSVQYTPDQPGLYAVEVSVTGEAGGVPVDRATFLTFEAQPAPPTSTQVWVRFSALILGAILALLLVVIGLVFLWRRKKVA